jgi:hypothetical protein
MLSCDFGGCTIVVDLGGALGEFLQAVLRDQRDAKGILLELPNCIQRAKKVFMTLLT